MILVQVTDICNQGNDFDLSCIYVRITYTNAKNAVHLKYFIRNSIKLQFSWAEYRIVSHISIYEILYTNTFLIQVSTKVSFRQLSEFCMPIFSEVCFLDRHLTKLFLEEDFIYCIAQNMINRNFYCLIETIQSNLITNMP